MARDLMPGSLQTGQLWSGATEDPMAGLANLMDVMLVFACGLMLALVTYWNVDLSNVGAAATNNEYEVIDGELDAGAGALEGDTAQYEEMGVMYKDSATGRLYVVPEQEE